MFARPPSLPSVRGRGRAAPLAAVALLVAATFAPAAPAHAEPKLGRVQKLEAREDGSRTVVTIHGTATPTFTVYKLERPERVVVDVANAELGVRMDGPVAINTWAVGQIAAQELGEADAAVTRVIVQLARPSTYQVKAQGNDVVVTVTPREPKPSAPVAVDEASRADAQAARAEASKAKAEADRAKADASAAKADASAAKADAEAARAQANAAKADAEQTKRAAAQRAAEADERLQTADERLRAADARMAQAEQGLREADTRKKQAEAAQKQAERALADADQRGKAADDAARAAEKQRAAAERAAAEAAQVARRAEAAGDVDAARKRKEAEEAAARAEARRKDAEARRKEAEDAAARAEARRQDAEHARAEAESSRSQAERAKQDAQRQKQLAERDRDKARAERDAAEKARLAAEKARVAEEQRAQIVAEKRAQEEERTRAAEGARGKEEQAARAAGEQRKRAEAARVEAESALASVQARRGDAEKARLAAEGRTKEANKAAREAEAVARAKGKQSEEWKRADERARALEERQRAAEAELAQRKRALADEQANADRAAAERDAAVTAAGAAKSEAEKARTQRQAEEKRKAQVEAERMVEERKLAEAKQARVAEEGKLAVAEQRRRSAEEKAVAEQQRREAEAQAAEEKRAAAEQKQREAEAIAARKAAETKPAPVAVAKAEPPPAPPPVAAKPSPAKAAPAPVAAKPAPVAAKPAPVAAKPAPAPAPAPEKPSKNVRVANVDYVDRDQHARVVVQLSGPAEPQVIASTGRQAILSIPGVDIPASLERSLDTSEFSGPVTAISSYRDPRDPGRVRIVVDLAEPAQAKLVRAGNTWYWDFEKPAAVAKSSPRPKRPAGAPAARAVTYEPPVIGGYGAASTPVTSQTVAQKKKVYRGKRIDLDFKDADLHNLLRLLAQVGDVNIVIPDDVKATVTVRLTDVPWDQAMEVILQSKGLWYRREGRLIRVADRKLLDAEDEEERARKRALVQEESPESVIFTLNYSVADDVAVQARTLLSPKGKLEVDKRTNSLVITDVNANRSRIIDLLTQLDTQTPQIQIEARIVEARSTWSREIGVQWGFNALASAAGGNPTGLIFPSSVGVAGGAVDAQTPTGGVVGNPDFAVNLPATVGTGAGGAVGFNFGSVGGNFNLQLRLSAAEEQGAVRIVSAPKITVLNNIQATISQGVSIPIQVVSANGAQTSFVQADLKLTVTPHVSQRDCSIQLEVQVTKNEPDFVNTGARGDPSILTKVAETTLLIGDGETSVIGGIYTRNTGKSYSKVPFFGDIPILGFFFRQKRENDDRTEVLIFLSPKITNKASLRCEGRAAN